MKYIVKLTQRVFEETTILVEADSESEAEDAAIKRACDGEVEWHFFDACDEAYGIDFVEQVVDRIAASPAEHLAQIRGTLAPILDESGQSAGFEVQK